MRLVKYAVVAALLVVMGCGGSTALRSGKVYFEKNKDFPKAEEWFKKAIVEEPDSWEAYLYLAMSQAEQQKYAEAEPNFEKAMGFAPDEEKKGIIYSNQHAYFVKHYNKGITLNSVADYDEAVAEFEKAVCEYLGCPEAGALIPPSSTGSYDVRKVAQAIVKYQQDFFESGPLQLRPLPMSKVADEVGVHLATGNIELDLPVLAGVARVDPDGVVARVQHLEAVQQVVDAGASFVGGCCGTSPDTIRAFRAKLDGR